MRENLRKILAGIAALAALGLGGAALAGATGGGDKAPAASQSESSEADEAGENSAGDTDDVQDENGKDDASEGAESDDEGHEGDEQDSGEEKSSDVTGADADRANQAALAETGGGKANSVERDAENGSVYEVEVTTPDGSTVDVRLDGDFKVVVVEDDDESGHQD